MVAEDVTEAAELGRALVSKTEAEGAGRCHGVQRLQTAVVAQNVQRCAVRLPQEFEPRRYQLTVRSVLAKAELRGSAWGRNFSQ